ncbi:hypothetical protein GH714_031040 [Hevea brasiliensis]|uniref:Uncharacterized protein n=1 Tax=Hevea brasiliensis TaxID=3981 RepID=A0A6A6NK56_HEVBR|nr:hypothetical protein GH714_031040 [Hevea brasiliensis]
MDIVLYRMPHRISSSRGRGWGRQETMSQSLRDEQDEDQSIGHKPLQLPMDTQVSPTPLQLGGQVVASSSSSVQTRGSSMWDETEEQNVHLTCDKLGGARFHDILNKVRNEMLVKCKKSDIAYLHNLGPNWMKAEAKKLGRPPNKIEVFRATHTKKGTDGVFIDRKSRWVDASGVKVAM